MIRNIKYIKIVLDQENKIETFVTISDQALQQVKDVIKQQDQEGYNQLLLMLV